MVGTFGRVSRDEISNALRAAEGGSSKAHVLTEVGVRRLMPIECERLQGFPDGWTDNCADTNRYKQLGNAVAVPVVEWIGKRIIEVSSMTRAEYYEKKA